MPEVKEAFKDFHSIERVALMVYVRDPIEQHYLRLRGLNFKGKVVNVDCPDYNVARLTAKNEKLTATNEKLSETNKNMSATIRKLKADRVI